MFGRYITIFLKNDFATLYILYRKETLGKNKQKQKQNKKQKTKRNNNQKKKKKNTLSQVFSDAAGDWWIKVKVTAKCFSTEHFQHLSTSYQIHDHRNKPSTVKVFLSRSLKYQLRTIPIPHPLFGGFIFGSDPGFFLWIEMLEELPNTSEPPRMLLTAASTCMPPRRPNKYIRQ